MTEAWSLAQDLEDVDRGAAPVWPALQGARIFITGGTGFIGCWLLEALRHADKKRGLGLEVTVLTRDPHAFHAKAPHLASYPSFHFVAGDVSTFDFPSRDFSHLIHAATDASAHLNDSNPLKMFDTVVQGTRRALDFAVHKKVDRVLFLSSGAVYGNQPWEMKNVGEDWRGAPDCTDPKNTYAEAKRAAELLCGIYERQFGLKIATARIFALLGPYLSLDIHFAAGNFVMDAMNGRQVLVKGNGQPVRSLPLSVRTSRYGCCICWCERNPVAPIMSDPMKASRSANWRSGQQSFWPMATSKFSERRIPDGTKADMSRKPIL